MPELTKVTYTHGAFGDCVVHLSLGDLDGDDVLGAAAALVSGFISNLLLAMAETQEGHDLLHQILFRISLETHEALGFSDDEPRAVCLDTAVVMKDVGDA